LGSGGDKDDENVWRSDPGGGGKENHGLSASTLRAGESEGIAAARDTYEDAMVLAMQGSHANA
jgi:hypothetical protein